MSPVDIIVLALIAVAFAAVIIRAHRRGPCADCAQGGTCGHSRKGCPALKGVDKVTRDLSRGMK